ncbi:hypothetical protein BH23BAC1_BH23BAC1_12610 [soil metagenome]
MENSRLEKLLQFYQEDPHEPFNIYAIALEYLSQNNNTEAKKYFDLLLEKHKNYLPTYYHAASFYTSQGNKDKAGIIYQSGITLAQQVNNNHTLRELRNAYNTFLYEED